ncbi:MAG: hypothetical protein ACRDH9_12980 [Actinomycetota bacterium]
MTDPRRVRILARLNSQEGWLIEAALIGITAGLALVGVGYWGVSQTRQETPPPRISVSAPAPLPPPPSNLDEACVRNAYETQGLIWDAAGNGARFEPPGAMWFIPGIVSGSGSVYAPREVEAKVKHRFFLAQRKWTQDCKTTTREDLPTMPPPPTDPRQLYYGVYEITWGQATVDVSGGCSDLSGRTTFVVASPGESISGVMIDFFGPSTRAQLGGDRFNLTEERTTPSGYLYQKEVAGTFVERDGTFHIESGQVTSYLEGELTCSRAFTATRHPGVI